MRVRKEAPRHLGKRALALFLSLIMCISMLQLTAFAADSLPAVTVAHQGEEVTQDGITVQKSIAKKSGTANEFEITLDVTIPTTKEIQTSRVSADVVLVLDMSGSMCKDYMTNQDVDHNHNGGTGCTAANCAISHAVAAAKSFANSFLANNEDGLCRVGVIGYGGKYTSSFWGGSWSDRITTISGLTTSKSTLDSKLVMSNSDIYASGGTPTGAALKAAKDMLDASTAQKKYVILLSDGAPSNNSGGDDAVTAATNAANALKTAGITVFTVGCNTTGYPNSKNNFDTCEAWLKGACTQPSSTHYVGVTSDKLDTVFGTISNTIQNEVNSGSKGGYVTDPMAANIVLDTNALAGKESVSTDNGTITWDLTKETPTETTEGTTTYKHYVLTYPITVNRVEAFYRAVANSADSAVPTNGTTTLHYSDVNDPTVDKTIDFDVPTVTSALPQLPYSVVYYLEDAEGTVIHDGKTYSVKRTVNKAAVDLFSVINLADVESDYNTRYTSVNNIPYNFAAADTSITIGLNSANVMNVYYDRIPTSVTINTFYKLKTIHADGSITYSPVASGNVYSETAQSTATDSGKLAGESYTYDAPATSLYGGVTYTLDAATTGSASISALSATAADNVINVYYRAEVDERADASVVVNHTYNTYKYHLVNGSYERYLDSSVPVENAEVASNMKATMPYTASTNAKEGFTGFTFNAGESDNPSITLVGGVNTIDLVFEKTVDERVSANVTVIHHYTKTVTTVVDGEVVTTTPVDDETDALAPVAKFVGASFTVDEDNTYMGDTYVSDAGNAAKLTGTVAENGNEIHLYYTLTVVPATTTVTVNHYYRTTTTTTVFNEETQEYENVETTTTEPGDPVVSGVMYVGESYTASTQNRTGFAFNEDDSDELTVNAAADNATEINLYYDKAVDDRDEANINAQHIYTTHMTTIVGGEVQVVDVADGTDMDTQVNGRVGDTYSFETKTERGGKTYTVVGTPALSGSLKVPGKNADVLINYERRDSNLVETTYTVNYNYKTYTMFVDTDGVAKYPAEPTVETGTPVHGNGYVGQKVTIADGAREGFGVEGTNPATQQILAASGNSYTFNYVKYVPLAKGSVQVNHHYTTNTIAADGTESSATVDNNGTAVEKYLGEAYSASAAAGEFDLTGVKVNGKAAETADVVTGTVTGAEVIDFYYVRSVDLRVPASFSVQHIYKTYDWDGTLISTDEPAAITGNSYVGFYVGTTVATQDGAFELVEATYNGTKVEASETAPYTIIMADGRNDVVYTYAQHVDTREDTQVRVTHKYFAQDSYTNSQSAAEFVAGNAPEYVYEEVISGRENGIWVGNSFMATLRVEYTVGEGENAVTYTYNFVNADPADLTIEELAAAVATLAESETVVYPNEIVINYLRIYSTDPGDAQYTVTHSYYTNGDLDGSTSVQAGAKVGDVINAADIAKVTTYNGNSYNYTSATPDSITVSADGSSVITLRYDRTVTNPVDEDDDPPAKPPVVIVEPDVPLTPMPEEPEVEIPEEETPLADAPKTGDPSALWMALTALSGTGLAGLAFLGRKKREEED